MRHFSHFISVVSTAVNNYNKNMGKAPAVWLKIEIWMSRLFHHLYSEHVTAEERKPGMSAQSFSASFALFGHKQKS